MSFKQVEGSNELYRDMDSQAIINTDRSGYLAYKTRREQKLREIERIDKLEAVSYTHLTLPTKRIV